MSDENAGADPAPKPPTRAQRRDDTPENRTIREIIAEEDWSPRAWGRLLVDLYGSFDRRTLGFSRILLGFLLLTDVIHRGAAWDDMYTDIGVLPTWMHLQRPSMGDVFSIFNSFSTPGELRVLQAVMIINALCLMIGYRTKVAQVLALILQTGMNTRISMIENGGYVVNNLLVMWTAFLPMGDRFSVDAMLASMKRRRETTAAELNDKAALLPEAIQKPFRSAVGFAITIQIAAIYYFNVIHKTGSQWKDGTAVHYVLYTDRMVTPFVAAVRDHIPNFLIKFMTRSTLTMEALIPVALLQPLARPWARRVVIFSMCTLHIGFGTSMTLGPFAWSCILFATLLFSSDDWEIAAGALRRLSRARVVAFNPSSGAALLACRVLTRVDRFGLLEFVEEEGLEAGLAVRKKGEATALPRAEAFADVVAALPLGPVIAWFFRAPGVKSLVDAVLHALEERDVSKLLGLGAVDHTPAAPPDPPREPVTVTWPMVVVSVWFVAVAVAVAVYRGRAIEGVVLVAVAVSLAMATCAWFARTTTTFADVRRAIVIGLREALVLAMFAGAVNQALVELWCINKRWKIPQPEPLLSLSHKLRFLQGWFMFSPVPVTDDGTIVVDAVTVDGRHIDPLMGGAPPNFDLISAKSLNLSQIWGDYFNRMKDNGYSGYRQALQDYIYRYTIRTGRPEDAIVSGDVYWVHDMNPKWGETNSWNLNKDKLFSFQNPKYPQPPATPAGS